MVFKDFLSLRVHKCYVYLYTHKNRSRRFYNKSATMAIFQENGRRGQVKGGFQGPVQYASPPTLSFLNKTSIAQDSYAISRSFSQTSYDPSIPLARP